MAATRKEGEENQKYSAQEEFIAPPPLAKIVGLIQ
jgi:hypothetical protein